ncbi:hypothetical protein [Natronomonas sp.]|jgi:TolA-binding protein|uniref:hypothetical protein n=1 Tax=Natronomonas sp. TaxID=2184060 RepID=UPI003988AAB1
MPPAKFRRQTPDRTDSQSDETAGNGEAVIEDPTSPSAGGTVEVLIEEIIESQTTELREQLGDLRSQLEEVEEFARISLDERKVKQNETKLTDLSASLTAFAEESFNNINALEDRLDRQALILAAVLESMGDDVDLSEVHKYEQDRLVADASPDERLQEALAEADDSQ